MIITVSREIPGFKGYFANNDGSITKPNGQKTFGCHNKKIGRHIVKIDYKPYYVNRLVGSAWVENPRPDIFHMVDHINRNEIDNRPENVRWVNCTLNALNNGGLNCCFDKDAGNVDVKGKWKAHCRIRGVNKSLGRFKTFLEGFRVGQAAKRAEFARLYAELTANATPCQVSVRR